MQAAAISQRAKPAPFMPLNMRAERPVRRGTAAKTVSRLKTPRDFTQQFGLDLGHPLVVDLFAGGGGASTGLEAALGRPVDIAINHNPDAIAMHQINHPQTTHYMASVWEVEPRHAVGDRPVFALHASPDCCHFSQAKGGQPRDERIRSLSWVVAWWAGTVQPTVITIENVPAITKWGPLIAKRDPQTGRVMKLDGTVAEPGEQVPRREQFLIPDPRHEGRTWRQFVGTLERMGYRVAWRTLLAADYGANTTRKRLFLQAVRDNAPISWPAPTHASRDVIAKTKAAGLQPYRPAHEVLDWSIPVPSIFGRDKELAEATCRRIARGIQRFVIDDPEPFILEGRRGEWRPVEAAGNLNELSGTTPDGQRFAIPSLIQRGYGERVGQAPRILDIRDPLGTAVAGGVKAALVAAFMAQHNGGFNKTPGHDLREPMSTITNSGSQQQLVTARLVEFDGEAACADALSGLEPQDAQGAQRVSAFLMRYYGSGGQYGDLREPAATITTKARLALVVVHIDERTFVMTDIGMRMLEPKELYAAQGMPQGYVFDRRSDGTPLTKTAQIRMVGNSVSPYPMEALYRVILDVRRPLAMAA